MPDLDPNTLTLALLLTTTGSLAVATFIMGFVAVLGRLIPGVVVGREVQSAALIALVIVVLLAVAAVQSAAMPIGIPLVFAMLFAWYAVTRLAMSLYDDLTGKPSSLRSQVSTTPPTP